MNGSQVNKLFVKPVFRFLFLPGISSILLLEVPMRGFCEFAVACVVGYVQFSIVVEFSQGSHPHHISIVRFQYFNQQLLLC